MSNRGLGLLSLTFIILSAILFIRTGALFYAGLIGLNSSGMLAHLGSNRGFKLVFMIVGLIFLIFTVYQAAIYFS